MTRIASASTMTAYGFLSAALTIGCCSNKAAATLIYYKRIGSALTICAAHSFQQILEHRPRFIADDANDVIADKARRELIAACAAASDRIARFQFAFCLREMIELAFPKHDHRHRCFRAAAENQRDRYT